MGAPLGLLLFFKYIFILLKCIVEDYNQQEVKYYERYKLDFDPMPKDQEPDTDTLETSISSNKFIDAFYFHYALILCVYRCTYLSL